MPCYGNSCPLPATEWFFACSRCLSAVLYMRTTENYVLPSIAEVASQPSKQYIFDGFRDELSWSTRSNCSRAMRSHEASLIALLLAERL